MTYVNGKFYLDPTPERLHQQRLEREKNQPPRDTGPRVAWHVNAEIMRQMDLKYLGEEE